MPDFISLHISILQNFLHKQPLLLPHHPAGRLLLMQHCSNAENQSSKCDIAPSHHTEIAGIPAMEMPVACISTKSG
ncbi:hypothetical protein [Aquitalea aquatilis]|uniref:hypothetical protein n=1 Tax=Aquitalea aquatilis TaxID=1537400 RepID=UPI0010BD1AFC|nr:hypothetical protein [Aquitalea aquatilis]